MTKKLTTKGIEVEHFVGSKKTGEILALSPLIKESLTKFMTEPDARNVEYATEPSVDYKGLLYELLHNRMLLRDFLSSLTNDRLSGFEKKHPSYQDYLNKLDRDDEYTILPGSCIGHEFDQDFIFSDPDNPYYKVIRDRYGTSIVTSSLHLNFGTPDSKSAIEVTNAMRLIASQVLAISACSPFHNGNDTGYQSYRWHSFPGTPKRVPIFKDLEHFIKWNEEKVASGEMFNVRHLWCAVRPNGPTRPHVLNRVELRISDMIFDLCDVIGLTSYLEMRFLDFLENGVPEILKTKDMDLVEVLCQNNENVAKSGFEAKIFDYVTESEMTMREQLSRDYEKYISHAKEMDIVQPYSKLENILENGNKASHYIKEYEKGKSIREILKEEALKQEEIDRQMFQSGELVRTCD